ncbi:nucleotidyltransferase family protein [Candidatus Woesearchaeota archaeon]|nr:nucleotidyltransferase family protein [Candidatus Woesearchaeota archaeon]
MLTTAFILSGGIGERLKPLTDHTAKTLLPIQGKPKVAWNMELAQRYGIPRIVLGLGQKAEQFQRHFRDAVSYSIEQEPMGTAGALKLAQELIGNQMFVMMNGDELKDININEMLAFHRANRALATLAITEGDVAKSGCVKLDGEKISYFIEKPEMEAAPSTLISAGLYILEPEIFDYIPRNTTFSIERDVWPLLAAEGRLFGFRFSGQFLQTDTLEKYQAAEHLWKGFREPA